MHPRGGAGLANREGDMTDYRCAPGLWEGAVVAQTLGVAIFARYTVMSGTPEKILELLLEAMRPDSSAHDPTGRGRRHPACSLTNWVVSTGWERARHLHLTSSGAGLLCGASRQEVLIPVFLAWVGNVVTGAGHCWYLARGRTGRWTPQLYLYLCLVDLTFEAPPVPTSPPYRDIPQRLPPDPQRLHAQHPALCCSLAPISFLPQGDWDGVQSREKELLTAWLCQTF